MFGTASIIDDNGQREKPNELLGSFSSLQTGTEFNVLKQRADRNNSRFRTNL